MCKMPDLLEIACDKLNEAANDAVSNFDRVLLAELSFLGDIVDSMLTKITSEGSASPVVSKTPFKKRKLNTISEFDDHDNILKGRQVSAILPAAQESNESYIPSDICGSSTPKDTTAASQNNVETLPMPLLNIISPLEITSNVREKRHASKVAAAMNSKLLTETLIMKMRRPDSFNNNLDKPVNGMKTVNLSVKLEKADLHSGIVISEIIDRDSAVTIDSIIVDPNTEDLENKENLQETINLNNITQDKATAKKRGRPARKATLAATDVTEIKDVTEPINVDMEIMPPPAVPVKVAKKKTVQARNNRSKKVRPEPSEGSDTEDESNTSIQNASIRSLRNRNIDTVQDVTLRQSTRSTRNSEKTNVSVTLPVKQTRGRKIKLEETHTEEKEEDSQRNKRCRTDSDTETESKKTQGRPKRTRKAKKLSIENTEKESTQSHSPAKLHTETEQNVPAGKGKSDAVEVSEQSIDVVDQALTNAVTKGIRSSRNRSSSSKRKSNTEPAIAEHPKTAPTGDQTFVVDNTAPVAKPNHILNETVVIDKDIQQKSSSSHAAVSSKNEQAIIATAPPLAKNGKLQMEPTVTAPLNQTITLAHGQMINYDPNCSLLTDDESEVEETPPRPLLSKTMKCFKKIKEIFESPVKNHVMHFESLAGAQNLDAPTRVTRTKTRAMAAKEDDGKENIEEKQPPVPVAPVVKPMRSKIATPITMKLNTKHNLQLNNPTKPVSAQIQRVDGEDANRKREQLLIARSEEQRRKREEKCRAAALAREAQDKLKQTQLEKLEREKEEKSRQLQMEREERLREEAEKKRLAQERKAAETEERRKQDEANRQARLKEHEDEARKQQILRLKQQVENERLRKKNLVEEKELMTARKLQEQKNLAAAAKSMASKPSGYSTKPVFKTFEELDTDDESETEGHTKRNIPPWCQKSSRLNLCKIQGSVKPSIYEKLYSTTVFNPNLADIFPKIDRRKLVRTSSAVWKTPPRFSMMPTED